MIRNVIFDVGNVFVRWSPSEVTRRCFDLAPESNENRQLTEALFHSPIWMQLNLGEITQVEAESAYQAQLGLTKDETKTLFFHVLDHLDLIDGTETIARRLKQAGYRLFGLTDNEHEIVAHLKARYQFWNLLEGYVVSAEIGLMKPHQDIFRHAIKMFGIIPSESIFLDDVQANVNGAQSIGMKACRFTSPSRCEQDLRALGLSF